MSVVINNKITLGFTVDTGVPHSAQRRNRSHTSPPARHSTRPSSLGLTAGLIKKPLFYPRPIAPKVV
jgi:hypothetical protein